MNSSCSARLSAKCRENQKRRRPMKKFWRIFLKARRKIGACPCKFCTRLRGGTCRKQDPCPPDKRLFLAGAREEVAKGSGNDGPSLANHGKGNQARNRNFESVQAGCRKTIALERQNVDFRNPPRRN